MKKIIPTCPGLNLTQSIFSCLSALKNLCLGLNVRHSDLSQPVKASCDKCFGCSGSSKESSHRDGLLSTHKICFG